MQNEVDAFAEIKEILRAIKKVEYGPVEIIIHGNQIVQIETREKIRFEKSRAILRNSQSSARQLEAEAALTGIVPENHFDPSSGKWGGIEVAVRYSRLDIDEDAFPIFADPLTSASSAKNIGAGLNWYLNKNVKFMFSYDHTNFETADIKTEQLLMTRFQIAW